jgi:hypothetical protein
MDAVEVSVVALEQSRIVPDQNPFIVCSACILGICSRDDCMGGVLLMREIAHDE